MVAGSFLKEFSMTLSSVFKVLDLLSKDSRYNLSFYLKMTKLCLHDYHQMIDTCHLLLSWRRYDSGWLDDIINSFFSFLFFNL